MYKSKYHIEIGGRWKTVPSIPLLRRRLRDMLPATVAGSAVEELIREVETMPEGVSAWLYLEGKSAQRPTRYTGYGNYCYYLGGPFGPLWYDPRPEGDELYIPMVVYAPSA